MNIVINKYLHKLLNHPEIIFIILALIFGSFFIKYTPPACVPDEPSHIYRSCEVASGILYNKHPAKETLIEKKMKDIIPERIKDEFHFASRYSPVMYIAPAIGIKIASLLSDNSKTIFYAGRFFNLLLYIILIAAAIRISPVFKYLFMYSALFPMSLFLGMSYNADSFNTAFSFLLFAYIFRLIYKNKEITDKQFSILSLMTVIGAFCKGLIYPVFLYFFINFKKNKYLYILPLIVISISLSLFWIHINCNNINPLHPVINDTFYFLHEPLITIKRILLTTFEDFNLYLKGIIGILGWMSIVFPQDIYYLAYTMFILTSIILGEKVTKAQKIVSFLIFSLFYVSVQYIHLIYWSDIDSNIIKGVQGRYFLALMPLLFIVFSTNKIECNKYIKTIFKVILIIFIIYLLNKAIIGLNSYYNELGIQVII